MKWREDAKRVQKSFKRAKGVTRIHFRVRNMFQAAQSQPRLGVKEGLLFSLTTFSLHSGHGFIPSNVR